MANINERDPAHGARTSLIHELMRVHQSIRSLTVHPVKTAHPTLFEAIRKQRNLFAHHFEDWSTVNWQDFDDVLVSMINTLEAPIDAAIKKAKGGP